SGATGDWTGRSGQLAIRIAGSNKKALAFLSIAGWHRGGADNSPGGDSIDNRKRLIEEKFFLRLPAQQQWQVEICCC
ncbi:MAG: hypothetical protein AAFQ90_01225, partial [Pseudomonadota bacterium]